MARYNWDVIAGDKKIVDVSKNGDGESHTKRNIIVGLVLAGSVGIVIWWKDKEDKQEKAALRRFKGEGDPELFALLKEENARLGIK